MTFDPINPDYYHGNRKIEAIDVIEDWKLGYNLGNALKYISRNGRKPGEDVNQGLSKAIWYLERQIKLNKINNDYIGQAEWHTGACLDG